MGVDILGDSNTVSSGAATSDGTFIPAGTDYGIYGDSDAARITGDSNIVSTSGNIVATAGSGVAIWGDANRITGVDDPSAAGAIDIIGAMTRLTLLVMQTLYAPVAISLVMQTTVGLATVQMWLVPPTSWLPVAPLWVTQAYSSVTVV